MVYINGPQFAMKPSVFEGSRSCPVFAKKSYSPQRHLLQRRHDTRRNDTLGHDTQHSNKSCDTQY